LADKNNFSYYNIERKKGNPVLDREARPREENFNTSQDHAQG